MSFTDYLKNSGAYTKRAVKVLETSEKAKDRNLLPPPFYVNRLQHTLPPETKRWIKTAADERAAIEYGCRFITAQADYAVNWVEKNCLLYEGDKAGENILLGDWQYDMYMQVFGWHWFDAEWERKKTGSGWLRRYKILSGWVPKKNTKSPTLASLGLYLFAGDGEQGQKCFSLATVRDQAMISHTHAINFIRQSPTLASNCKIDATTGCITDRRTNSTYSVLCGDKNGLVKTKEGINGSLFIDETHVVNWNFMKVVKRAGISRRQPLKAQLSTAGENTDGYGYDQYEMGKQNLVHADEGRDFNFRLLHIEYAIPQTTSVDDLRDSTKIESFIRMANPTIGRVITYTEAHQDWKDSLRSDTELMEYAMYRLNMWCTGGGAYVAGSDWMRCTKPFKFAEISEHPCVIGADLSRIRDMTAVVLIFAVPQVVQVPINRLDASEGTEEREINIPYIFPFFWVPRRTLSQYSAHLDIDSLEKNKQLFVTDGPVIRAEVIAEHIQYLASKFDCRGVASDMYYSKALSASLASTHGWDVDNELFLIPQTFQSLGPAVDQLQGCILSQELVHNSNDIMNWQRGNIVIEEDKANNRRFAKPKTADYRKIDGWAALLNGFCLMMNDPDIYPGATLSISLAKGN